LREAGPAFFFLNQFFKFLINFSTFKSGNAPGNFPNYLGGFLPGRIFIPLINVATIKIIAATASKAAIN